MRERSGKSVVRALAAVALAAAALGCVTLRGPDDVARRVALETGNEYVRESGLTVGRTGMAIARWAVRHDEDADGIPIRGIRKVEIGVWTVSKGGGARGAGPTAAGLPGWSPLVAMRDADGESVLVLSKADGAGRIRKMLVVVEDGEELVVVRMRGDLEGALEQAVRYALRESDREDLVEPTVARLPGE